MFKLQGSTSCIPERWEYSSGQKSVPHTMPKVLLNNVATVASTPPSTQRVTTTMTCRDSRRKSLNKGLPGKSEAGEVDETSKWLKRQVLRALRVLETRRLPPEEVKEGFYRLTGPQGKTQLSAGPPCNVCPHAWRPNCVALCKPSV